MEKFEQNLESEDSNKEFNRLQLDKTTEEQLAGIAAAPETFSIQEIQEAYTKKVSILHEELLEIQKYLTAKGNFAKLTSEVEQLLLGSNPVSGITINEKMAQINYYKRVISFFEKMGAPEAILAAAKETQDELANQINTIVDVADMMRDQKTIPIDTGEVPYSPN